MPTSHRLLRWAVIGASTIAGQWMVGAIRAVGDKVVAVVSSDLDRAKNFARQHGIAHALDTEADLTGLKVDAVNISSTNEKHEPQTLFAALQVWHVLCEKPLATSLDATRRMVAACRNAGVVLGINHHLRHNSAHRQMRDVVRAATLGRLKAAWVNSTRRCAVSHTTWPPANRASARWRWCRPCWRARLGRTVVVTSE